MSALSVGPSLIEGGSIKIPGETIRWATAADEETIREWLAREVAARAGLNWRDVAIVSSAGMKPRVEIAGGARKAWQVSLSYTRCRVAGAIAFGRSVGIDLEWIDPEFRWEPIAAEFFPALNDTCRLLPSVRARREFFQKWVRAEAALKCRGIGGAGSIDQSLLPAHRIQLANLDLTPEFAGCVAWIQ